MEAPAGRVIGRLAAKTEIRGRIESAIVSGIMVRTKARTDHKYLDATKAEVWEVPVVEVQVVPDC